MLILSETWINILGIIWLSSFMILCAYGLPVIGDFLMRYEIGRKLFVATGILILVIINILNPICFMILCASTYYYMKTTVENLENKSV